MPHREFFKDNGELGHDGGIASWPFKMEATGAEVPFDNSITGYLTVYQDQLEKIYCSFSPTQKIQNVFFFIIFVIIFEVNIVAEQKQAH